MRRALALFTIGVAVVACSDATTQPSNRDATAVLSDSAQVAKSSSTTPLGNTGVLLAPPNFSPGSCLYVPDGDLRGFIRVGPDGKAYLKVNDHQGTVIVTPLGGQTWVGTGRATIDWPNYQGSPANNVNMQVDGDVSSNGVGATASCHYLVANGKSIQQTLTVH